MEILFDTIIVINLDRCKDRYDRILSRIQSSGLDKKVKIIRLSAVDGTSIDEDWLRENNITPLADYYDSYRGRGLTMGEIGCAISHYRAWELINNDDTIKSALILEDDAQFCPEFSDRLNEVQEWTGDHKWELFYLGRKVLNPQEEIEVKQNVVIPDFSYWCLSYIVNKEGASKLVNSKFLSALIPADEFVPIMLKKPNYTCIPYMKNYNIDVLSGLGLKEQLIKPETLAFQNSQTEKTSVFFKNEFYNDGVDKFILLTVATEENDHLDRFRKSCEYFGIPYKVLGLGTTWNGGDAENGVLKSFGGGQKINLLKEELSSWLEIKNHIVMFTDSYDVMLLQNPQVILSKFRDFKRPIVFSAEKTCWPNASLIDEYPNSETKYRFLNSGGFIGYANEILEILKEPIEDRDDDQLYYTQIYLNQIKSSDSVLIDKTEIVLPENKYPITKSGSKIGWMSEPVFDKDIVELLVKRFDSNAKILDIGAGDGKWGYVLSEHFKNIDAIEIFEPYVDRYDLKQYYKKVTVGNFLDLDFDYYDVIIMGDVFEHVKRTEAVEWLDKIKNKCGELIIVVPFEYQQEWDGDYENKWGHHYQPDLNPTVIKVNYPQLQLRKWVDSPDSTGKGKGFGLYTKKYGYDYLSKIFLDTNQYIFQTLNDATDDIEMDMVGRIRNRVTNNFPAVIHANGPEKVKKFLDKITDFMTGNYDFFYGNKSSTIEIENTKTVSIGLFFQHNITDVKQTLDLVEILKYPKDKTSLVCYYNRESDLYKLNKFKDKNTEYNSVEIVFNDNLTDSRVDFLERGEADYYLIADSNFIFRNTRSLEILMGTNKKMISPMIVSETGDYANFHIMETDLKNDYINYEKRGIWSVDIISGIMLIEGNFRDVVKESLTEKTEHTDGDWDVKLSEKLKEKGYFCYICNTNYFGTII
jgi:GR25 family glycosyltransferase involved in LPS biosynthesis